MRLLILLATTLFISACATSGKVTSNEAMPHNLNQYSAYFVEVKSSNATYKEFVEPFKRTVSHHLENTMGKKIAKRTPASNDGILIELTINNYDKGNNLARLFNMGGETKINATGKIFDLSKKKLIHTFNVEGTSLRESQTSMSIGGSKVFDTKWVSAFDETTQRAFDSAGIYLAKYIAGNE